MVDTDIPFFMTQSGLNDDGADPSLSMRTTGNLEFLSQSKSSFQCAVTIVGVIYKKSGHLIFKC